MDVVEIQEFVKQAQIMNHEEDSAKEKEAIAKAPGKFKIPLCVTIWNWLVGADFDKP